jgi:serine/threonine-protein kinase
MEIDVGRVIGDKYRLVRLLGRGSMGEVWAAHHQTLGEHVALKLLTQAPPGEEAVESPEAANARFQFEAQLAARLSRKTRHIVRVTDHGEEDDLAYLVMELLEGETLEAVLRREGRLDLSTVAELVRQIARALTQAHGDGVAHRDLKPANVFITHDEDGRLVAKLLDFGIARALHAHRVPRAFATARGLIFGTPSYMSPEQARGSSHLDHRCDLWALATLAYEASTAELPIEGNDTDEVLKNLCAGAIVPVAMRDPQLATRLGPFFERAFASDIAQRFQSASDFATAFAKAVGAPVGEVSVPSASELGLADDASPSRRQKRRALFAAGAFVIASAAVALAWRALARSPEAEPVASPAASAPAASTLVIAAPPTPAPTPTVEPPSVPLSALPRVPVAPTVARPLTPAPPPPSASAPVVVAPSPPPAVPVSSSRKDRSEVF